MPFFSIIMPSFNRAHVLPRAIEMVLSQTFTDYELIIVDDGSSDNTKERIAGLVNDPKVIYFYQENKGVCSARNHGAKCAKGEYLVFLDSDDEVTSCWLNDFYTCIQSENYSLVFCSVKVMDTNGNTRLVDVNRPFNSSKSKGFFVTGSWAVKTTLFIEAGMYDENIKFGENSELKIRLDELNLATGTTEGYNFIYHVSANGGSQNFSNKLNSILYTVHKHQAYFQKYPGMKKVQLQTAAIAAIRAGLHRKANEIYAQLLLENKMNLKIWIRYFLTLNGFLTRIAWRPK